MSPILHHYPASLFSEKVRALLGFLDVGWQSVEIPPIMPRPWLMPLSGGYRKTPIMQIGANVFCDTQIICRELARRFDGDALYANGFAAEQTAAWADSELFRLTVAINFRPDAIAAQMGSFTEEQIAAFQADRAELSGGAPMVVTPPEVAFATLHTILSRLERSFEQSPFLFGDQPSIADFSVYHCLWFVAGNPANEGVLAPYPGAEGFVARMANFGHGSVTDLDAEDAFLHAKALTPEDPVDPGVDARVAGTSQAGAQVAVAATDYGTHAVTGRLLKWRAEEIVIAREDAEAGAINVHFPNVGFGVT